MPDHHVLLALLPGTSHELALVRHCSGLSAPDAYLSSPTKRQPGGFRLMSGVGVIELHGPLLHRWDGWYEGYDGIANQLDAALQNPDVRAIVLSIDSPGGMVDGCAQLGEKIRAATAIKPIHACINDLGASAAYWLASACDQVSATKTSRIGSIGVRAMHIDMSNALEKAGLAVTELYVGDHKADGSPYAPLSDTAREHIQASIDYSYHLFVSAVAAYRSIDAQAVIDTQAAVYDPPAAKRLRLIDSIETPDAVIARLSKRYGAKSTRSTRMSDEYNADKVAAHVESARTEGFQAGYEKGLAEGEQKGDAAATARISAILDLPQAQGRELQARKLAASTKLTPPECAEILATAPVAQSLQPAQSEFAAHMAALGNPQVGADAQPSQHDADNTWGYAFQQQDTVASTIAN